MILIITRPDKRSNRQLMLNAGVLTFQEFAMREPLPLATIHEAVLEFIRGRKDVVVFGATAVNAYVSEARMTQDIDLMSQHAMALADELRTHLSAKFHIAIRVRVIGEEKGYRVFQIQKTGNRHLVDIRSVEALPRCERIENIQVMAPAELIARKVISYRARRGQPKAGTDWRDIAMLLLAFSKLKRATGPVLEALKALKANELDLSAWNEIVAQEIKPPDDDAEFD